MIVAALLLGYTGIGCLACLAAPAFPLAIALMCGMRRAFALVAMVDLVVLPPMLNAPPWDFRSDYRLEVAPYPMWMVPVYLVACVAIGYLLSGRPLRQGWLPLTGRRARIFLASAAIFALIAANPACFLVLLAVFSPTERLDTWLGLLLLLGPPLVYCVPLWLVLVSGWPGDGSEDGERV